MLQYHLRLLSFDHLARVLVARVDLLLIAAEDAMLISDIGHHAKENEY